MLLQALLEPVAAGLDCCLHATVGTETQDISCFRDLQFLILCFHAREYQNYPVE